MPKIRHPKAHSDQLLCLEASQIRSIAFADGSTIRRYPGYWIVTIQTGPDQHEPLRTHEYEIIGFSSPTAAIAALESATPNAPLLQYHPQDPQ